VCAARLTSDGVLISQPVHQHAYETALAAQDGGQLRWFATGMYDTARGLADPRLRTWLPARAGRRIDGGLRRRRHPDLDPARILTIPWYHLIAMGLSRSVGRLSQLRRLDLEEWAHHQFDAELGRRLAKLAGVDLVHAFEGAALATFQAAKRMGKRTILDVPSAHERYMQVVGESPRPRIGQERLLADLLLAPSDFVVTCLMEAGAPADQILKIPYGVDPTRFRRQAGMRTDEVFRAVFVGRIQRRKGLSYLLEAWRRLALPRAELLVVGAADAEGRRLLEPYRGICRFAGPHPRHEIHRFYQQSDVFVFPSLAEGSALVTYEALACGLPLVTTPNSGSVVRDGIDGLVVGPGDVEGLCERIRFLYDHPEARQRMGAQGRDLIQRRYTWRHYRQRIGAAYAAIFEGDDPRPAVENAVAPESGEPGGDR
jgi:glycosyltransferase involved in cell wall biosynthesis